MQTRERAHTHTHTYTHAHIHARTHSNTHTHTHTHALTQTHTHTRTHGRTRAAVTGGEREEGGGLHQRDEFTDCCVPASPLSCTSGLTTRYVTLCSGVCHRVLHTKHHLSPLAATEVCTQALCQTSFLDSFNTQSVSVLTPQTLDCFRGNAEKPLADGVERMWAFPRAQLPS